MRLAQARRSRALRGENETRGLNPLRSDGIEPKERDNAIVLRAWAPLSPNGIAPIPNSCPRPELPVSSGLPVLVPRGVTRGRLRLRRVIPRRRRPSRLRLNILLRKAEICRIIIGDGEVESWRARPGIGVAERSRQGSDRRMQPERESGWIFLFESPATH